MDNTVDTFLKTKTINEKISLITESEIKGKGSNLFTFIEYGVANNAKYFATFDGDLTSIKSNWVKKMLSPIISGNIDYVSPLYSRNRYEGNTTNHFCVPYVNYVLKKKVAQPIGGEFSFSRKFAEYIVHQHKPVFSFQYGIDIFFNNFSANWQL